MFKKMSLSKQILLRSLIAIFILFILVLVAIYYSIKFYFLPEILKSAEYQVKARAAETELFIQKYQDATKMLAELMEKNPDLINDEYKLQEWLKNNRYEDKNLANLAFLNMNGELLSDTGKKVDFTAKEYGNWYQINSTYYDYLLKNRKVDTLVSDTIFSPFLKNKEGDKLVNFATFALVKDNNGNAIGALASFVRVEDLRKISNSISIGDYTLSLVSDSQGVMIGHTYEEYVGQWNMFKESKGIEGLKEEAQKFIKDPKFKILNLNSMPYENFNPTSSNITISVFLMPIKGTIGWALGSVAPLLLLQLPMLITLIAVAIVFLISFLIFFMFFVLMNRYFNKNLKSIADKLAQITSGDGDLTARLDKLPGNDALSILVTNFNDFVRTIADLVKDIMQSSADLGNYSDDISHSSDDMNKDMELQQKEIEQISASMQQMVQTVTEVASYAQKAADIAQKGSSATQVGAMSVTSVIESIKNQSLAINATASDIEQLQQAGISIGEVMEIINAIAEQTNLLALNAAIEAARAGDAGRGFAVVADEVRNLAGRTHESTEQISQTVNNLRNSIDKSAKTMRSSIGMSKKSVEDANQAGNILNKLKNSIQSLEDLNLLIASATEEQTATVEELSGNLTTVVEVAGITSESALNLKNKGVDLNLTAYKLQKLINRFKV